MIEAGDLLKAYNDTTRVQIDMGADPEVLDQLGFDSFEDTVRLMAELSPQVQHVASAAGAVICMDCGQIIPCPHAGWRKNGQGFTRSG